MALNTPAWWYKRNADGAPWWRFVLWPLSLVWRAVNALKRANARPYRSSVFVISVGNLTLGGSGKTPLADEILRLLNNGGHKAVGLSKGYGGTLLGPALVDPLKHTASQVGDEALMLAQNHDFVIAKSRMAGLKLIEATDTQIAVVDDAHQNLQIAKDMHILVIDGDTRGNAWPFGDGGVCPYGPMREPLSEGLARADLCVLWMPDEALVPDPTLVAMLAPKPVFIARLMAEKPAHAPHVLGFAGIAKPWKFEATLRRLGYEVIEFRSFPDHVSPSQNELEAMSKAAEAQLSTLMTTQKDWIRLDSVWRERITCLPISARFDDEQGFSATLMTTLAKRA